MTRRITFTMVGVVAGALLVASVVTLLLSQLADRRHTRSELAGQASRLATSVDAVQTRPVLAAVGAALKLEGEAIVVFGPAGNRNGALPDGVTATDLHVAALRAGRTVTGAHGRLVYAAAPATFARAPNQLLVVVLTRRLGAGRGVGPLVLLVGAVTLAVAAAIAASLGRRLIRPLREAEQATRRIAAGDLAARVPVHPSDGEDLAGLAESINAMAAGLERSRGMERQFLLSVSHDLRTPLTSIRGYAEALADRRVADPAQAASVVLSEARRLERLVADLLELAKLGTGRFSLDVRRTDVAEVVGETAGGFLPAAEEAGVALGVGVPARGHLAVAADPDRLAQVVANLVENALKFAGTRIQVGAGPAPAAGSPPTGGDGDTAVVVWVDDDGPGMTAGDLAHAFQPFWQSSRSPSRQVGTGLGLAIVAELVEAMGGSVRAEPGPGGGTRVVVTLRPWR
ncbi:MAG: ATP-binding protein [Acidimicrobiales bacterium]